MAETLFPHMAESPRFHSPAERANASVSERKSGNDTLPANGSHEKGNRVPESLREAFKAAADVAVSRIMKRVASKEGMPTDAQTYRGEIIAVLKEMDAKLPE